MNGQLLIDEKRKSAQWLVFMDDKHRHLLIGCSFWR